MHGIQDVTKSGSKQGAGQNRSKNQKRLSDAVDNENINLNLLTSLCISASGVKCRENTQNLKKNPV